MRAQRTVVEAARQLGRTGRRLLLLVREQQPAVLGVGRAHLGEPAEPGPVGQPVLQGPRAVRADQHDLQGGGGVQGGELRDGGAREAAEPGARPGEPQGARLAQFDGHRHGGPAAVLRGGAEPDGERVRVVGAALPEPGPGAERGQQHRRRVRPPLVRGLGAQPPAGGLVRPVRRAGRRGL